MNKLVRSLTILGITLGLAGTALAGTIRVENSDSKDHKVEIKCSGSSKSFEIKASTTTSYTFDSMATSCEITGGTVKFTTSKLEDGQKWKIKDGNATPN